MSTTRSVPTISTYSMKLRWLSLLHGLEDRLVRAGVSPNAVTLATIPVSTLVGVALLVGANAPFVWLTVLPLVAVQLALNALDGSMATRTGRTTRFGAVLNEAGDRYADAVVVVAAALIVSPWLALWAGLGIAASEGAALLAWALDGSRPLAGPMAKPDRALLVGCSAAASMWWPGALPVVLVLVGVGGFITAIRRIGVTQEVTQ